MPRGEEIPIVYTAWNVNTQDWQTGDAANHTLRLIKDGTEVVPTNTPVEVGGGAYKLVVTAAENSADAVTLRGTSATTGVKIVPASWQNGVTAADLAAALATAGQAVVVQPVAEDGDLTLYAGADYTGSKALVWTVTAWTGTSVNGEAVTLALMKRTDYEAEGNAATPVLEVAGTASQSGTTVTVTVGITEAQVEALDHSPPLDANHYQLRIRSDVTRQILVDAPCTVKRRVHSS